MPTILSPLKLIDKELLNTTNCKFLICVYLSKLELNSLRLQADLLYIAKDLILLQLFPSK